MIGENIIVLEKVDSTNVYARALIAREKLTDGTVILAREQVAGKGQGANTWLSEPGKNLTLTVVLYPDFLPADQQFTLNKVVALGVLDFVFSGINDHLKPTPSHAGKRKPVVSIKWPNDIYADDRKIAGILIEHQVMGNNLASSVIGIGLNINQITFPQALPNPVSLSQITGVNYNIDQCMKDLCRSLDLRLMVLRESGPGFIDEIYAAHLLGYDHWQPFQVGSELMEGKILGVDAVGRLIILNRNGETVGYSHHEISYIIGGK
jgi:BirA family biotin operon repressor/biotin-[acetyl-CoA-carboxylase] ligase